MSRDTAGAPSIAVPAVKPRGMFTIENRFLPPILITGILLAAHVSFGVLES